MNFLGHCLLTQYNPELIAGNIGGDHFKGDLNKFTELPKNIKLGVEIHRFIDSYTDNSEEIQKVAKIFQNGGVRRVSYIASDIILDYFISNKWQAFSSTNLKSFIKSIYINTENNIHFFPDKFQFIFNRMKEKNWLSRYADLDGIELTLYKFEQVIPFNNNLHESFQIYLSNQQTVDELYESFMYKIINEVNYKFKLNISL